MSVMCPPETVAGHYNQTLRPPMLDVDKLKKADIAIFFETRWFSRSWCCTSELLKEAAATAEEGQYKQRTGQHTTHRVKQLRRCTRGERYKKNLRSMAAIYTTYTCFSVLRCVVHSTHLDVWSNLCCLKTRLLALMELEQFWEISVDLKLMDSGHF